MNSASGETAAGALGIPADKQRGGILPDLLSLAALLAALVAANREWLFSGIRWLDTWMYLGYFQHYAFAPMLDDNKKIGRLPWILLGYAINHLTSPKGAQYVLHIGLLSVGAAALYFLLRREFGRLVAVITTAFYLTYIPAHGNGGWDYHNALAGPLYVAVYASLIRLTESPSEPFKKGLIAGLASAFLIHTNIIFVLVAPALVGFALLRITDFRRGAQLKEWLKSALTGVALGGVGLTLVLCIVNVLVGRPFFFFLRLVNRSAELVANPGYESSWWRPWSASWWYSSYHAPLILMVLAVALVLMAASVKAPEVLSRTDRRHIGVFLGSLVFFLVGQSMGHPLLEPYYMAFPLLLPAVIALAALLHALVARPHALQEARWSVLASVITCAVFGAAFVLLSMHPASWHFGQLHAYDGLLALAPFISAFAIAWLLIRMPTPVYWIAVALPVAALAFTNGEWPSDPNYRLAYSAASDCKTRQATFNMVMQADRMLFPLFRAGNEVPLVYRTGDILKVGDCNLLLEEVARPIGGLGYGTPMQYWKMETMPELPDDVVAEASQKQKMMAVVSKDGGFPDRLLSRLQRHNENWHVARKTELADGPTAVEFTILSRIQ